MYLDTGKRKMNPIKFIVVVSIALLASDLLYHQVVNGQNSTQNNASKTVDKLIEDTKRDQAIDRAYKGELVNRILNSTCEYKTLITGEFMKTSELEDLLKRCVAQGAIK